MHKTRRSPFTSQENAFIKESVRRIGEDWEAIAKKLPGRTPKQVHDRYVNYLRDGLINGPWTKKEDEILLFMYNAIGPKWTKMMFNLPGRSGNDIKNRWHKHLIKEYKLSNDMGKDDLSSKTDSSFDNFNGKETNHLEINSNKKNNINSNNDKKEQIEANSILKPVFSHFGNLVEPIIKTPEGHEIALHQQIKTDLCEYNSGNNFGFDSRYFQNQSNNHSEPSFQKNKMIPNKAEDSVKIINKVNIQGKQNDAKNFIESGPIESFNSSIIKPDFAFQEILEDLNSESFSFLWI